MPIADEQKRGWLARLIGGETVKQIEEAADTVQKQADSAGLAFKAKSDVMVEQKADGATAVDPTALDATSTTPDEAADNAEDLADGGADEAAEGEAGEEYAADMTRQQLHDLFDQLLDAKFTASIQPIQAMLEKQIAANGGSATKETEALLEAFKEITSKLADALIENTTALKAVQQANATQSEHITALQGQVAELNGELPRAVVAKQSRASQAPETAVAVKAVAAPSADPDMEAIARLAGLIAGEHGGLLG